MKEETNLLKLKDKKLKQIEYQEVRYDVKIKDELSNRETWVRSKMRYLPSTYLTQVLLYQLWVKVQFYLHHIPNLVCLVFWTDQDIQSLGQQTMSHCRHEEESFIPGKREENKHIIY
jgi:hypothetical protein